MVVLTNRLMAAASLVREGARLADVGTDHAYLPVYLCQKGIVREALASDIAQGPLSRAEKTIAENNCGDRIGTLLTPGLDGVEKFRPTDVTICGMGGETIASIIEAAPFVFDENVRLILQPMTKPEFLYAFLSENGFAILDERLAREKDKIYRILLAVYTGDRRTADAFDAYFGSGILEKDPLYPEYRTKIRRTLENKLRGMQKAERPSEEIPELLRLIGAARRKTENEDNK